MAALLERITTFVYDYFFAAKAQSTPAPLDSARVDILSPLSSVTEEISTAPIAPESMQATARKIDPMIAKLWKNADKAIREHQGQQPFEPYASVEKALPSPDDLSHPPERLPLQFQWGAEAVQGSRRSMEDAHCVVPIAQGLIAGVFDGHGGAEVATYACEQFATKFSEALETTQGDIKMAFQNVIDAIQCEVTKNHAWREQGTTAVLSFLDLKTHHIYTATLGDSEANIYRKNEEGALQSIPLSCVRHWGSQKDATRALQHLEPSETKRHQRILNWTTTLQPKRIRYPYGIAGGVNISRAIGDKETNAPLTIVENESTLPPAISHKPKITVQEMHPGDLLILACDGLKDFVSEKEIIDTIQTTQEGPAQALVRKALVTSTDNITVLAIQIQE